VRRPHGIILGHWPDRLGQDDDALLDAAAPRHRRGQRLHDRRPDRDDPAGVQPDAGAVGIDLGFTEGLRALMRQDPDIIMVGEIRDLATADMAIQASLTGHLVFSTLHTNDSASAITRLNDLGVPPYLIGSTLIGVLAQRLVRTLCSACKVQDADVTRETLHEVVKPWRTQRRAFRPYKAVGCLECRMTGFRGRAGLFELLTVSDAARSHDPAGLRREQAAPAGAAGRPAAAPPRRRDEGRRRGDHARRGAARDAGLGVAAGHRRRSV
jgi:general secretion pathway protein E